YTQSAVSRQIASLERAAGTPLLERRHDGVRLTAAGQIVVRRAVAVVDQVDATARELAGLPDEHATVRLGWFASAGAALLPRALTALRRTHPAISVITREGSTPALVRALRAGTVDLALLASEPPFPPPAWPTPCAPPPSRQAPTTATGRSSRRAAAPLSRRVSSVRPHRRTRDTHDRSGGLPVACARCRGALQRGVRLAGSGSSGAGA